MVSECTLQKRIDPLSQVFLRSTIVHVPLNRVVLVSHAIGNLMGAVPIICEAFMQRSKSERSDSVSIPGHPGKRRRVWGKQRGKK